MNEERECIENITVSTSKFADILENAWTASKDHPLLHKKHEVNSFTYAFYFKRRGALIATILAFRF